MKYVSNISVYGESVDSISINKDEDSYIISVTDSSDRSVEQYDYIKGLNNIFGIKYLRGDSYYLYKLDEKLVPLLNIIEVVENREINVRLFEDMDIFKEYYIGTILDGVFLGIYTIFDLFYKDFVLDANKLPEDCIINYLINDSDTYIKRYGMNYYAKRFLCSLRIKDVEKFQKYALKCRYLYE